MAATAATVTKRVPSRSFIENAVFWMKELQQHPAGDLSVIPPSLPNNKSHPLLPVVGDRWPGFANMNAATRQRYHATDCIGYVTDVLQFAFLDVGDRLNAAQVKQRPWASSGMDLAKYLVEQLRWKAYYWNPDPDLSADEKDFEERPRWFIGWYCNWKFADPQPAPGQEDDVFEKSYVKHFESASPQEKAALYSKARNYASEHSFTARQAKKPGVYGVVTLGKTIPVTDSVTGYRPNIPRGTAVADYLGRPQPKEPAAPTPAAQRQAALRYAAFASQVKFGFGVVRGGEHTYLFSSGDVYEFHWDAPPADRNAFGVTPLPQWGWESGAIIVPPETQLTLPPEAVR